MNMAKATRPSNNERIVWVVVVLVLALLGVLIYAVVGRKGGLAGKD